MTKDQAIKALLDTARSELGYHEKKSNSQLDDKTANSGSKNWTKYARDLDNITGFYNGKKNGPSGEWCDIYVDWCFCKTFGETTGRLMLYQPLRSLGAGTGYSTRYFKESNAWTNSPAVGDQIFFTDSAGKICHTGIVEKVEGDMVHTIEGNTNNMVARHAYMQNSSRIAGYGRPRWALAEHLEDPEPQPSAPAKPTHPTLSKGSKGDEVKALQEQLLARGYSLPKWGADGDFGDETDAAVRAFQRANGLEVDGIVGPLTWAALDKPVTTTSELNRYKLYTVQKGDTLTKIATAHRVSTQTLKLINELKNPNLIRVGQVLKIPY